VCLPFVPERKKEMNDVVYTAWGVEGLVSYRTAKALITLEEKKERLDAKKKGRDFGLNALSHLIWQ